MSSYYISLSDFNKILEKLLERSNVYAPVPQNDRVYFEKLTTASISKVVYDTPREIDPPKSVLFPAREVAAKYFGEEASSDEKPVTLIGIKGCDGASLVAYERVMVEGDVSDPLYRTRAKNLFVIGTDCAYTWPTCFCTLVGLKPYPEMGVDINLSKVEKGFIVDVKSEKGKAFYEEFAYFFRDGTVEEIEDLRSTRDKTVRDLSEQNKGVNYRLPIHEIIKGTLNSPTWRKITRFCTECGACNIACPTCTCFTFLDERVQRSFERIKLWDACLKGKYARVAGGANTRPLLFQRYNNRLQCKFDYSFDRINMYTCTGCGRCIECCPAKIDMRDAIKELEGALALSAKLE